MPGSDNGYATIVAVEDSNPRYSAIEDSMTTLIRAAVQPGRGSNCVPATVIFVRLPGDFLTIIFR